MRVTVLKTIPDDPELRTAWNGLVSSMENPEVFFTHQWALAVSRSFRKDLEPVLFLVYDSAQRDSAQRDSGAQDSAQLVGLAALAVHADAPRAAIFLASSTADYCDIVSAPGNRRAVLLAVLQELRRLGLRDLVWASVPANSATITHLQEVARKSGFWVASRASSECRIIELGDEQQRQALVQTVAAKSMEKRGLKKLRALGSVRVVHATEPQEVRVILPAIVSAQVSRFLVSGRASPLLDPERRDFLVELGDLMAQAQWLKISQLEVKERLIAWNYGFSFQGSWFWYLPSFLVEYSYASPGSCLLRLLVEEACGDTTLRWLDLGLGDESYKIRFANAVRQSRYVQLSRSLPKHVIKIGRQELVATLARSPNLESKIRGVRERYRSLSVRIREAGMAATAHYSLRRTTSAVVSASEVLIFQSSEKTIGADQLVPMNLEHLVQAALRNAGDPHTLAYLMRCAARISQPGVSGFVLQNEQGQSTHFLWISGYDGFHLSEIDHALEPMSPDAAMIFDCWTPHADRGQGSYASAIQCAASRLVSEGRTAWIFSGANNAASLRGILKSRFAYRFSLIRRRKFGRSSVARCETTGVVDKLESAAPHLGCDPGSS